MRWLLAVAALGACFVGLSVLPHGEAREVVAREERARTRLVGLARRGPPPRSAEPATEPVEDGYRFTWRLGDDLPALCLASPTAPEENGFRWFASADGEQVFTFDVLLFRPRGDRPDPAPLRRWLARPAAERADFAPPAGWRRAE